ncbi:MAG: thiamine diphosphokinase [Bacillota bacterium]|nr:MAG: thiamine diphosphokinase [Bacillota bacterium]
MVRSTGTEPSPGSPPLPGRQKARAASTAVRARVTMIRRDDFICRGPPPIGFNAHRRVPARGGRGRRLLQQTPAAVRSVTPAFRRAAIFGNGYWDDAYAERLRGLLEGGDLLRVAADGGIRLWQRLGYVPHVLLGDFDSLSPEEVGGWEAAGVEVLRYPVAKDKSDLELALDYAAARGAASILLAAVTGSRLDHSLANLFLAARFAAPDVEVTVLTPGGAVYPVVGGAQGPGARRLPARPGDVVALLPVAGPVKGVTTHNLRYALRDADLAWGSTLPISNEPLAGIIGVEVREGRLLVIVEQGDREVAPCASQS